MGQTTSNHGLCIHSLKKVKLFDVDLKHCSFLPSADVKPMKNDLAHAMPWHVSSLYAYTDIYI